MGHCVPSWNTVQCRRCFPAVLHCAVLQGVAGIAHASFPPCHCVQDLQHEYNATAAALLQAVSERLPPLDVPAMLDRVQVRALLLAGRSTAFATAIAAAGRPRHVCFPEYRSGLLSSPAPMAMSGTGGSGAFGLGVAARLQACRLLLATAGLPPVVLGSKGCGNQ